MKTRSMIVASGVSAVAVGCALTYAPGDYGGSAGAGAGAGSDSAAPPASDASSGADVVTTPPPDGGPGGAPLHVLVVAGERDGSDVATSDVWSAPVDDAGDLGAFTVLPPGPVRGVRSALAIADGKLLVATKTNADRVVESAPFDGGTSFGWQTSVVANPTATGAGQLFAGTSLVAFGGFTTKQETDTEGNPVTITTYEPTIQLSAPDAGAYPKALTTSTEKLPLGTQPAALAIVKDLVFFWGDGSLAGQRAKLFSGRIVPALGLAGIKELPEPIFDPAGNKAHTPTTPVTCAGEGHLFILGGDKTDIVITATYDETQGTVGAWKNGPVLPRATKSAACAVLKGRVYVFGGLTGTGTAATSTRTDEILVATVAADGTIGPWTSAARRLPGARSNVFALTY